MKKQLHKQKLGFMLLIAGSMSLVSCGKESNPFGEGANGGNTNPVPANPIPVPSLAEARSWLADKNATEETAALFYQMKKLAQKNIMFGHQDATKRGYNWANEQNKPYQPENSDVKEIAGNFPAVYGNDFLHLTSFQWNAWFEYEKETSRKLTIDAYNRGGVNTFAWHYSNPVSQGSFYWSESPVKVVPHILPGGSYHDTLKSSLQRIAAFVQSLRGADGKLVPIVFRPYHEFDGDWFWWGKAHCSPEEYKQLYRFTVVYLRDSLQVRNILYAWSPDKNFSTETQYLERYPGDEYVDLVGMDNYGDMDLNGSNTTASNKLKIVSDYAVKKNKLAALTETGLANITQSNWFTERLLKTLKQQPVQLSYVLIWANTAQTFWIPYKGHPAEADFKKFTQDPYPLLNNKLPAMYKLQ